MAEAGSHGERLARVEERQDAQSRVLEDLRAEIRALKWTLAGVASVAAALGALAGAFAPGALG